MKTTPIAEGYDEDSKPFSEEELGNAPTYGRKLARWLGLDEEVYVRDNKDLEGQSDYTVEYREGRFGSEIFAEFDEMEAALEEGKNVAEENLEAKLQ